MATDEMATVGSWFSQIKASLNSEQIKDIIRSADFVGHGLHPRNNYLANVSTLNKLMIACDFVGPVSYEYIKEFIIEWVNAPDSDPYEGFYNSEEEEETCTHAYTQESTPWTLASAHTSTYKATYTTKYTYRNI